MDARHASWIEAAVDWAAAAVLAAAVGYSAVRVGGPSATAAALAAAAMVGGLGALRSLHPAGPRFALAAFDAAPLPAPEAADELVLTDADRLEPAGGEKLDELVLDDVVARLEDFSRVVRLFDRSAMPTPGELHTRIERHLDGPRLATGASGPPPDATQALHDALSELRRTLR